MDGERTRLGRLIPYRWARRIVVGVIGGTVCLVGAAMIVLPGPAMAVIPLGLGILGLEFAWARRWLGKLKETTDGLVSGVRNTVQRRRRPGDEPPAPQPPLD